MVYTEDMNATDLRKHLFQVLDRALHRGEAIEITYKKARRSV